MIDPPLPAGTPRAIRFLPRAQQELTLAFDWYDAQTAGLGDEFVRAVDAVLAQAARFPQSWPVVRPASGVRRALVRRFPYGVFHVATERDILVVAIVHARQHPARWPSSSGAPQKPAV